jgi:large repetitive protein
MPTPVSFLGPIPFKIVRPGQYIAPGPTGAISGVPVIFTTDLASGVIGTPYLVNFLASGGTPSYTFTLSSGTLPPGCSLSSGGVLSGTPTTLGTFTFVLLVTDANGITNTGSFDVTITAAAASGGAFTFLS